MTSQMARGGRFILLGLGLWGLGYFWLRLAMMPLEMPITIDSGTFRSRPFLVWSSDDFTVADLQLESATGGFPALGRYSWTLKKWGRVIGSSGGPASIPAEDGKHDSPLRVGGSRMFLVPGVYQLEGWIQLQPRVRERYQPQLVVSEVYVWPQAALVWLTAIVLVELYGLALIVEALVRRERPESQEAN